MDLANVDISAALRRLAEWRIEEAIREGKFDNLPGAGKPVELDDMPAYEGARLVWWSLRILRQNGVIPDEVRLHKSLERLRERVDRLADEAQLPALVAQMNELVLKINTMGTNALSTTVAVPVDLERENARLRKRLQR